jgi:hypothetical protein
LKPIPRVADQAPGPGAILTPKSGIRDETTPEPGSGTNVPILFLRACFGLKILKFLDADPDPGSCSLDLGWKKKSDKHPDSATLPVPHKSRLPAEPNGY